MSTTRKKTSAWIVPTSILVMVTLACLGAVEGFYWYLGTRMFPEGSARSRPIEAVEPATVSQRPRQEQSPAQSPQPTPQAPPPPQQSAEMLPEGSVEQSPEKAPDLGSITTRNLFASRSGDLGTLPQPQDPLESLEASSLAVILMGTVTGSQEDQRAIIYHKRNGRQELYEEGDYIEQAAIKEILRGKVILSVDGRDEILDITEARTVNVPQVQPMLPVTTTEQVIGRPVGAEPVPPEQVPRQEDVQDSPPNGGSRVIVPRSGNPQVLRTIRK